MGANTVRFVCDAVPMRIYVCHCRECRRQSASAFGISVIVPRGSFRVIGGAARSRVRGTDSGKRHSCHFCPDCGSRLWPEVQDQAAATLSIKGGALDEPLDLTQPIHVSVSRKRPGVVIPEGVPQFSEED